MASKRLFGRREIFTDYEVITPGNVVEVLTNALPTHLLNRSEIQYLYNYRKGMQPILNRTKKVRPEIDNRIVVNRANEITEFKVGHLMGKPVQYISRKGDEYSDEIDTFNEYMFAESKSTKDKKLCEWFTVCGIAYRMVLPNNDEDSDSPLKIYTLDPRNTFIIKYSGLGNKPVMSVQMWCQKNGNVIYGVYTDTYYFEIKNGVIIKSEVHYLGEIPIIEYPANSAMLGAFEVVLPLLDAINTTESNRLDGIEQFVQALLLFKGVDIDSEDYKQLKDEGAIEIPTDAEIKYLVQELNQAQTQTLIDDMYNTVLTICCMPNRNGGSSTSDTGVAVIYRDGWSSAEAAASAQEEIFKESEKRFIKLAVKIVNILTNLNLKASVVEPKFTRRNYENIQEKVQVLNMMLSNPRIHPRLAFVYSGVFTDPESAYLESVEYYEQQKAEAEKELKSFAQSQIDEAKVNSDV